MINHFNTHWYIAAPAHSALCFAGHFPLVARELRAPPSQVRSHLACVLVAPVTCSAYLLNSSHLGNLLHPNWASPPASPHISSSRRDCIPRSSCSLSPWRFFCSSLLYGTHLISYLCYLCIYYPRQNINGPKIDSDACFLIAHHSYLLSTYWMQT